MLLLPLLETLVQESCNNVLKMYRDGRWIYGNRLWPMTSLYVWGVESSGPKTEVSILPKPHLPSGTALSCIGDGFLNPLLWRPFKVTSDNSIPVKSISSLINTSCVRGLSSNTCAVWRGILVQQNINEIICEVIIYNTQANELQKKVNIQVIFLNFSLEYNCWNTTHRNSRLCQCFR